MAPAEKIFYFSLSCVWDLRRVTLEQPGPLLLSPGSETGPPLASVMESWEEFYGCLSPLSSFFLLSSLKNDFRHFIYIFNQG